MPARNPVNSNVFDLVTTIIPDPGAGNDIAWPCPANSRVEFIYLGFIFTTNANVADRYISILGATPTLNQTMGSSSIAQPATNTWGRAFVASLSQEVDLSAVNIVVTPISPFLTLEPGDSLETMVHNIQAGDTIASIITRYRQWVIA